MGTFSYLFEYRCGYETESMIVSSQDDVLSLFGGGINLAFTKQSAVTLENLFTQGTQSTNIEELDLEFTIYSGRKFHVFYKRVPDGATIESVLGGKTLEEMVWHDLQEKHPIHIPGETPEQFLERAKQPSRGWYRIAFEIAVMKGMFDKGTPRSERMDFSCEILADSIMDAYEKAVEKCEFIFCPGKSLVLEDYPEITSCNITFMKEA